jgi:hypothetical protein
MLCAIENSTKPSPSNPAIPRLSRRWRVRAANPAVWHNRKPGVRRMRRVRMRRHYTSIQGARHVARRVSRARPHQPYAAVDSCALPQ